MRNTLPPLASNELLCGAAHSMAFQTCAALIVFRALRFRRQKPVIDYHQKSTHE
jgi:hypothetical protein